MLIPAGTQLINAEAVLDAGEVKEGDFVADLGAGATGYYVFPAARRVGKAGKVYAVDIQQSVLDALRGRIALSGDTNLELVWGDIERLGGTGIPDDSLDVTLIVNNLSGSKSAHMLAKEAQRITKRGGFLVVVDWKPTGAPFGPRVSDRIPQDKAEYIFVNAGFAPKRSFSPGAYHYGVAFEKT